MKKYITLILLCAITLFAVVLSAQEGEDESEQASLPNGLAEFIVTGETANLRDGPGTNYSVVGTVSNGDTLLIFADNSETPGWYQIYSEDDEDIFIADFLVERAPQRYYSILQEPLISIQGDGREITDIYDIPQGAYRVDAVVDDNFFIFSAVVIEGECRDSSIFNEGARDRNSLTVSTLFISRGCTFIFESDNVDGDWSIEFRDILDEEFMEETMLTIENGTIISGTGTQITMPTFIEEGIWTISATVQDQAFILESQPLDVCDSELVFNELDFDVNTLEVSTVFRATGDCIIFWLTDNVDGEWEIIFEKLR